MRRIAVFEQVYDPPFETSRVIALATVILLTLFVFAFCLPGTVYADFQATGLQAQSLSEGTQSMHRLYNPNSGEHFYTASANERDGLVRAGWRYEGVGWTAPEASNTPVYRLYSGTDHHYTTSKNERNGLIKVGWRDEGIGWYSDDAKGAPLYRQFNPNVNPKAKRNNSGSHNYTTSKSENDGLVRVGWKAEGIGWYGIKVENMVRVESITASVKKSTLDVGETTSISVSVMPKNATNDDVTYISSDTNIATVSTNGMITAKMAGTVTITVTSKDNSNAKASVALTVNKTPANNGSLTATASSSDLTVGDYATIAANINSKEIKDPTVRLTSSDCSVIMIKDSGKVFASKAGKAVVTVSSVENPSVKTTVSFTVSDSKFSVDSDGDGVSDYTEKRYVGTDPNSKDNWSELPDMVVLAEDVIRIRNNDGYGTLNPHVGNKHTSTQKDDPIYVTLATLPNGLQKGSILLIDGCENYPNGIAIKVTSILSRQGKHLVTGKYPNPEEFIRFLSVHQSTSSMGGMSAQAELDLPTIEFEESLHDPNGHIDFPSLSMTFESGFNNIVATSIPGGTDANALALDSSAYQELIFVEGDFNVHTTGTVAVAVNGGVSLTDVPAFQSLRQYDGGISPIPLPIQLGPLGASEARTGLLADLVFYGDIEGNISLNYNFEFDAGCHYKQLGGAEPIENTTQTDNVTISGEASGQAGLRLDLSARVCDVAIAAAGVDAGVDGTLTATQHFNPALTCFDLDGGFHLDGYAKLLANLPEEIDVFGLSATVHFLDEDNNPLRGSAHFELGGQWVPECTWIPEGLADHRYLIVLKDRMDWEQAKAACETIGGHLATITSEEEQEFINSINYRSYIRRKLWIGGYLDGTQWKWVTGEDWRYTNWGEGEPNNSSNVISDESCVAIWPQRWNDLNGQSREQEGYLCEWDDPDDVPDILKDSVEGPRGD